MKMSLVEKGTFNSNQRLVQIAQYNKTQRNTISVVIYFVEQINATVVYYVVHIQMLH